MFGAKKQKETGKGSLEQAKNWYADRYQFVVVQRNVLFLVTLLALVGLGATTFAVARLTESKTFEPYVIEIESKTGITTLVDRYSVNKYSADETVQRYFILKYLQAREGYDVNNYTYNYSQVVRVLSSNNVYNEFRQFISLENPRSPVNLGREFRREVQLKSMTFLEPKKVQARILLKDTSITKKQEFASHAIVTLTYDFLALELTNNARYINPLGFQITSYRIDEDVT